MCVFLNLFGCCCSLLLFECGAYGRLWRRWLRRQRRQNEQTNKKKIIKWKHNLSVKFIAFRGVAAAVAAITKKEKKKKFVRMWGREQWNCKRKNKIRARANAYTCLFVMSTFHIPCTMRDTPYNRRKGKKKKKETVLRRCIASAWEHGAAIT